MTMLYRRMPPVVCLQDVTGICVAAERIAFPAALVATKSLSKHPLGAKNSSVHS